MVEQARILDIDRLAQRYRGRETFVDKLLRMAESEYDSSSQKIRDAVLGKDYNELRIIAHTLKGMSGNIMADRLRDTAFTVEQLAREEKEQSWIEAEHLAQAVEELQLELRRILAETE